MGLLVVIAIIAILAAMLLPALAKKAKTPKHGHSVHEQPQTIAARVPHVPDDNVDRLTSSGYTGAIRKTHRLGRWLGGF